MNNRMLQQRLLPIELVWEMFVFIPPEHLIRIKRSGPTLSAALNFIIAKFSRRLALEIKSMGHELVTMTKAATQDNVEAFRAMWNSLQAYANIAQAFLIAQQRNYLTQFAATHPNFFNFGPPQILQIVPVQLIVLPQHKLFIDSYQDVQNLANPDLAGNDINDLALSVYNAALDVRKNLRDAIGINHNLQATHPIMQAISKASQVVTKLDSFVNSQQSFTDGEASSNSPTGALDIPPTSPS